MEEKNLEYQAIIGRNGIESHPESMTFNNRTDESNIRNCFDHFNGKVLAIKDTRLETFTKYSHEPVERMLLTATFPSQCDLDKFVHAINLRSYKILDSKIKER